MKPNKRSSNLNERRKSALKRLEQQLKTGLKPANVTTKVLGKTKIAVKLEEKDIKRIESEIIILKSKIR